MYSVLPCGLRPPSDNERTLTVAALTQILSVSVAVAVGTSFLWETGRGMAGGLTSKPSKCKMSHQNHTKTSWWLPYPFKRRRNIVLLLRFDLVCLSGPFPGNGRLPLPATLGCLSFSERFWPSRTSRRTPGARVGCAYRWDGTEVSQGSRM